MYDSWGSSWASAWGSSWLHQTVTVIVDHHDDVTRIKEYRRRREELHESILRAYEEVTGESRLPSIQDIQKEEKAQPLELKTLKRIKGEVNEFEEINQHILMLSKSLQEREMNDIAYIASIL